MALDRLLPAALRDERSPLAQLRDERLHPLPTRAKRVGRAIHLRREHRHRRLSLPLASARRRPATLPARACRRREGEHERHGEVRPRRDPPARGLVQPRRRPPGAAAAGAASGNRTAGRAGRPRAALPDGDHQAGGRDRPLPHDPGRGASGVSPVAPDASLSGPPPGEGARDPGAHLLQVRGRLARGLAQAEHRSAAGVLLEAGGHHAPDDRDRGRPVGLGTCVRGRGLRPRGRGLHGQGLVRPEAVPARADRDVRRARRGESLERDERGTHDPRRAPRLDGQPRHGDLRGGRGRGDARGHEVLPRLGPEPRAHAPDRDRRRGERPDGARRGLSGRRDRLHGRGVELLGALLPVHRARASRRQPDPCHRRRADRVPEPDEGSLCVRLRGHGAPDAAREDAHARLDVRARRRSTPAACATTAWRLW